MIAPPVVRKAAMAATVVVVAAAGARPATRAAASAICLVTAPKVVPRSAITVVNKAICLATALLSQALNASATNASNLATFSLLVRLRRLASLPAEILLFLSRPFHNIHGHVNVE